jgi:TRAP-type mannitol/chloroaromatic compound transport system substrate-binding protein
MIKKHGVQIRRTPPDILIASLKAWDEVAAEYSAKNPTFKKVYESQREYASKVVPAKRYMFPPYSFAANYYWPQEGAGSAASKDAKKPAGKDVKK